MRTSTPNELVDQWRAEGRQVPWVDPYSGGISSRILFLHEFPGPASSVRHGGGFISPDNNDQTAARFWRLSNEVGLSRPSYVNWNVVPWYVSASGKSVNASNADGKAALPYLHQFVSSLTDLRVIVVMGSFAEHWRLRYLREPDSLVLPLIASPERNNSTRSSPFRGRVRGRDAESPAGRRHAL